MSAVCIALLVVSLLAGSRAEECAIAFGTEQFAYLSGDPHFRAFNGRTHHFQGVGGGSYYLMKNCDVNDRVSQPFALVMNVVPYGTSGPTIAQYVILEVYVGPKTYYIWISSDTSEQRWAEVSKGTSHNIDECGVTQTPYSDGTMTFGNVKVTTRGCTTGTVYVTLDINQRGEQCQVTFHLRREGVWNGYPYHYVRADVPKCYKCTQCGLFGDFQSPWGEAKMLGCDGTQIAYDCNWRPGEGGYDPTGWTWEVDHVNSEHCSSDDAHPDGPPRGPLCSDDIKKEAEAKCREAMTAKAACCEKIGGDFCEELVKDCAGDACALAPTAALIPQIVQNTFTTVVKDECGECDLGFANEQAAFFSGDPHFRAFNGIAHHFQGKAGGFYYLMKNCDVTDRVKQPYALAMSVVPWGTAGPTVAQYVILEVYDGPRTWYVWISGDTARQKYAEVEDGASLNIDNCGAQLHSYSDGTMTFGKVSVTTRGCSSGTVYVTLDIDQRGEDCKVEFHVKRQGAAGNGYSYHYVQAEVPKCYKCTQCGLFGDFQSRWNTWEMLGCDGTTIQYNGRWVNTGIYDATGWTWEVGHVRSGHCSSEDAIPEGVVEKNPGCADKAVGDKAHAICQRTLTNMENCCNAIGGDFCEDLEEDCYEDCCAMSGDDVDKMQKMVWGLFADVVKTECPAGAAAAAVLVVNDDDTDWADPVEPVEPVEPAEPYADPESFADWDEPRNRFPATPVETGPSGYPQYLVNAMYAVAFLASANLVCLAINCLGKRRRQRTHYKVVSLHSEAEADTESEVLPLA